MRRVTSILLVLIAASALSAADARRPAEPKTEAGVLAADDDWLAAEKRGDVAALDRRLADGYRDVEPDGKVHPKAELLDWTRNRKTRASGTVAEVAAAFRRQNPMIERVLILGDTAILSFHSVDPTTQALVRSVDVFAYDRGLW